MLFICSKPELLCRTQGPTAIGVLFCDSPVWDLDCHVILNALDSNIIIKLSVVFYVSSRGSVKT